MENLYTAIHTLLEVSCDIFFEGKLAISKVFKMCIPFNVTILLPPWQREEHMFLITPFCFCVLYHCVIVVWNWEYQEFQGGHFSCSAFVLLLLLLFWVLFRVEQRVHFGSAGIRVRLSGVLSADGCATTGLEKSWDW